MAEELTDVQDLLKAAEVAESRASTRVKRAVRERKPPETLEEAKERILKLKLNDKERDAVLQVFEAIKNGSVSLPDASKKVSKKALMELWPVIREKRRQELRERVVQTRPKNYWVVQTIHELRVLEGLMDAERLTAWDTETTGLDLYNDRIVGWSIYLPENAVAAYVAFGHTTGQQQVSEADALGVAKRYLENPTNQTIWHHYKYDGHMFSNHGIRVANPYWDTQVAAKLLYEHESHRLKDLHAKYVLGKPDDAVMFEDLFDDHVIYDKDVILSGIYAAGDAHKTYQLYAFQKPYIDTVGNLKTVWYQIEQPLLQVDLDMERTGFRIDVGRMGELLSKFEPELQQAEKEIREAFNIDRDFVAKMNETLGSDADDFNIQSNAHLGYLLYDVLECDPNIGQRFKKGVRSTAADVIDALCEEHEHLRPMLRYRQLQKLVTTYLRKIPLAIEPATGRLHSKFNNMGDEEGGREGTATGRYSSSEYCSARNSRTGDVAKGVNLQNVSSKGEGIEVRKCFIPDDGWVFVGADLSQIEPRIISVILAEWYGDTSMQQMYIDGVDLYTTMAMRTFGLPRENCVDGAYSPDGTYSPRKLMKQGVLSYLYGTSAKSFARTMKVSEEVAQAFFDGMIKAFPSLKTFREDTIKMLLTRGNSAYVETLFGRKRRFPDYRRDHAELSKLNRIPRFKMSAEQQQRRNDLWRKCAAVERQALNTIIQGSAADVLKQSMIAMHQFISQRGYQLNASIHDELIISVPKTDLTAELVQMVTDIMTKTVTFSTPLKADVVIMERWMDEVKSSDWDYEKQCPRVA